VRRAYPKVVVTGRRRVRKSPDCCVGSDGLHTFLTVCMGCNLCKPSASYVNVGFGAMGVIGMARDVPRDVPWLIFDGDCAFCTSSAHWLARRLHRPEGPNARLVAWQFTDLAALGTSAERTQREALWVDTGGTIYGGAAAFAEWLKFRGGAYGVAGRMINLPVIRALAAAVYRLIAKNRHRMPGGSPACALPPPGFDPAQPGTKAL
jgi:predicted DCC family thiol-disulfide oxidoreductase YuxK